MKDRIFKINILLGNSIVLVVIACMCGVLLHERIRMKQIERQYSVVQAARNEVFKVHGSITGLSLQGETVLDWDDECLCSYHSRRMHTDTLLHSLQTAYSQFIDSEQIDTLRTLLSDKEACFARIVVYCREKDKLRSQLTVRFPAIAREATRPRHVRQKKKGVAGLFGSQETVLMPPSVRQQKLVAEEWERYLESFAAWDAKTDSMLEKNEQLNRRVARIISSLDVRSKELFTRKDEQIASLHSLSVSLMTIVSVFAILSLAVCYLFVSKEMRLRFMNRRKLEQMHEEKKEQLRISNQINRTVSHDIRGPLGNISNCARMAGGERNKKKRDEYLCSIQDACRHILHLVNNLLDLHYIDEARENLNEVPFSLSGFLERVAKDTNLRAIDKGLIFKAEYAGTDVVVKGDMDRLEQILDNLLSNAIKFTHDGTVHLRAQYKNDKLSVEIQDSGIGMDRDTIDRIFKPFERAAQDIDSSGFGLGLSITQGLVKAFSGFISVDSEPGKGSTFRISLPLPETTAIPEEEKENAACSISALLRRIAIIDDDRLHLKLVKEMLERNGVSCRMCTDTRELASAFRESDYDLVMTDIQMSGTDGFGVLRFLRNANIGNARTVPVAVMTAQGNRTPDIYMKEGFSGCLHKPFTERHLLSFLSSQVEDGGIGEWDFSSITEGIHDKVDILKTFVEELAENRRYLEKAGHDINIEEARKVIHRMAPTWKLLDKGDMLENYRKKLEDPIMESEGLRNGIRNILYAMDRMAKAAKMEIKRISHEEETDTDC